MKVKCCSSSHLVRMYYTEGEDILELNEDGFIYLGVIVEVERGGCLVRFGDRSERWSPLSRLKRLEESVPPCFPCSPPSPPSPPPETSLVPIRVLEARQELSYDFSSLTWDFAHLRNAQETYCYCGESGDWYRRMLQCGDCQQWFHQECLRANTSLLFGDRFWRFVCTLCTGTSEELVERQDISWTDALHLVLFNLTISYNNKFHDIETSILPFIKAKWKYLVGPNASLAKSKANVNFITSILQANRSRFKSGSELKKRSNFWGLRKGAPPNAPQTTSYKLAESSQVVKHHQQPIARGRRRALKPPPAKKFGAQTAGGSSKRSCNKKRDSQYARGTLDSFIPIPKNFEGMNNPFRSDSCSSSSCSSPNPSESPFSTTSSTSGQDEGTALGNNNFFKDLKSSLNSYFDSSGPPSVVSSMKESQFRVLARRLTSSGEVQYLVDREQSHLIGTKTSSSS